jgi:hypothetical protein
MKSIDRTAVDHQQTAKIKWDGGTIRAQPIDQNDTPVQYYVFL